MSVQFYKSGVGYYNPAQKKNAAREGGGRPHINNINNINGAGRGKISTIRDEERRRILALREQAKEDEERIKKNLEDHKRLLKIRKSEKRAAGEKNNSGAAQYLDLNSLVEEIRRPPPPEQNIIREQNKRDMANIETNSRQKELYEKNIESVRKISRLRPEDPCSVCYDDDPESMLIMVCCKQYFCFACIAAWWKEKKTCPSCRLDDPVFVEVESGANKKKLPKL